MSEDQIWVCKHFKLDLAEMEAFEYARRAQIIREAGISKGVLVESDKVSNNMITV